LTIFHELEVLFAVVSPTACDQPGQHEYDRAIGLDGADSGANMVAAAFYDTDDKAGEREMNVKSLMVAPANAPAAALSLGQLDGDDFADFVRQEHEVGIAPAAHVLDRFFPEIENEAERLTDPDDAGAIACPSFSAKADGNLMQLAR
jgi:hypothetical protein